MPIYRDARTGRWRFDFDRRVGGARLRRRQLLPSGWTRDQAEAFDRKESAALLALAHGIARPRYAIDDAVGRYVKERLPGLKAAAKTRLEIEATRDWWTGRAIDELPKVAADYVADQTGALAPATIVNRLAYLRAACRYAWRAHAMCDADPGARMMLPRVHNARHVYITRGQMVALARACRQWETRALIRVAYYTGWRYGEICRARVEGDLLVLDDAKNGRPRVLPIHGKIRHLFRLGWRWPEHETMWYYLREARAAVGLPELHFHDLRHATASAIISSGGTLSDVGAVLGHRSAASSHRYAHLLPDALRDAVQRIGRTRRSRSKSSPRVANG